VTGDRQRTRSPAEASAPPTVAFEAKLYVPPLRPEWVVRASLVSRLIQAADRKVVLVDAPAGYGKTTLVSQWSASERENRSFAWVSLDNRDNDPLRFWAYVVEALSRVQGHPGAALARELWHRPLDFRERLLPELVQGLDRLSRNVVLVLDDYHLIEERECHELVTMFIESLPSTTQLVIATRKDPPLPLARLRAAGELVEIRESSLRFDVGEGAAMVRNTLDGDLGADDLATLVERTEGWPAGLYLATLSLRSRTDRAAFIRHFAGDHRHVADYLFTEVLEPLPERMRRFLLQTSVLDRFTTSLCDAVRDAEDSGEILFELERSNLFLVPLDDRRESYRFHNLFLEMLRSLLRTWPTNCVRELHRRACDWHMQHGSLSEAIQHAIQADDASTIRELIAANWYEYVRAGRIATVAGWLRAVGEQRLRSEPLLAVTLAWVGALSGHPNEVRKWLPVAERGRHHGPLPDGHSSLESSIAMLEGVFGFGGLDHALERARRAESQESVPASPWYAAAKFALGCQLYLHGDRARALDYLNEAVRVSRPAVPFILMSALGFVSMVIGDEGSIDKAEARAREALDISRRYDLAEVAQASVPKIALGRVLAKKGDLTAAARELEEALAIRRKAPQMSPWPDLQLILALAPVRFALGDAQGTQRLLDDARTILDAYPDAAGFPSEVERLERSLGSSPQRPAVMGDPLTDREIVVLRLLATSLSQREIGDRTLPVREHRQEPRAFDLPQAGGGLAPGGGGRSQGFEAALRATLTAVAVARNEARLCTLSQHRRESRPQMR
jgi:LuxR family maltose regulon positive regulatory protein